MKGRNKNKVSERKQRERLKLLPVCKIPNMMAKVDTSYGNDFVAFDADLEHYTPTVESILTVGDILKHLECHKTIFWQFDKDHRLMATRHGKDKRVIMIYDANKGMLGLIRSDVALAVQHQFVPVMGNFSKTK